MISASNEIIEKLLPNSLVLLPEIDSKGLFLLLSDGQAIKVKSPVMMLSRTIISNHHCYSVEYLLNIRRCFIYSWINSPHTHTPTLLVWVPVSSNQWIILVVGKKIFPFKNMKSKHKTLLKMMVTWT